MTYEIDKKQVKKDLEQWAKRLREVDKIIRELYTELNNVYEAIK